MDNLHNAFSVLELDAEDDQLQPASASAASGLDVSASTATVTAGFTLLNSLFLFSFLLGYRLIGLGFRWLLFACLNDELFDLRLCKVLFYLESDEACVSE